MYSFLVTKFLPLRTKYWSYNGKTKDSHPLEWNHFPVLSSKLGQNQEGKNGIPRNFIFHLDGKNIINNIWAMKGIDKDQINTFNDNRHAQVSGAWKSGVTEN